MFITLEGIDGSGKSTQLQRIESLFKEKGSFDFLITKEPGGWEGGELLKKFLLSTHNLHPSTELLLFFADRHEHFRRVILPALERGEVVVCERYMDSTEAYQWEKDFLTEELMRSLKRSFQFPDPDCTLFLAMPPDMAFERAVARNELDVIESRGKGYLAEVAHKYEVLYQNNPSRITKIDASGSSEETWDMIFSFLRERLPL